MFDVSKIKDRLKFIELDFSQGRTLIVMFYAYVWQKAGDKTTFEHEYGFKLKII